MTLRDYTANVISASKVVPDGAFQDSAASGVWDINEALDLIKGSNWPTTGNFNPAAFVDNLFQTHVYDGNNSGQTITNGIDLSGKGGLVWTKSRAYAVDHALVDTVRGNTKYLQSHNTSAEASSSVGITAFNNNGYTLGADNTWIWNVSNSYVKEYVSWTFRKQPKFFDIVTWTGNGTEDRTISHNLGSVPGMIIVKGYSLTEDWNVYHRGIGNAKYLQLNSDAAASNVDTGVGGANLWMSTDPTSTTFKIDEHDRVNKNGESYVAYLFAHNDDDGGFGEPGDQDIIKCGSYTGNTSGTEVNLGFEPQFVMIKKSSASESWYVYDSMRGVATGGADSQDKKLRWNSNGAEGAVASPIIAFSANGFILESTDNEINGSGTYVYMAIRRGGMQTPSTPSDVFAIDDQGESSAPYSISGFPVDMVLRKDTDGSRSEIMTRLTQGNLLVASATDTEASDSVAQFDFQNGCLNNTSQDTTKFSWMWKRARGYFDVVVYEGPSTTGNISHNLGVVPEMIWVKNTGATENWAVYHKDLGNTYYLHLNTNAAASNTDGGNFWNSTTPTASVFSVGTSTLTSHYTRKHVAYLFATVAGVSKVGSYTGSGSDQTIDCGFTNGAKFVLIKVTSDADNWVLFDTTRGLVAGNDTLLSLNLTHAQVTNTDYIDPHSSGFAVPGNDLATNKSSETYIFYAIANDPS